MCERGANNLEPRRRYSDFYNSGYCTALVRGVGYMLAVYEGPRGVIEQVIDNVSPIFCRPDGGKF